MSKTQDEALRVNLPVAKAARRLETYRQVITRELTDFARLTGNSDLHDLSLNDLCTVNGEISAHTLIEHV